jgi:hypothetical protein
MESIVKTSSCLKMSSNCHTVIVLNKNGMYIPGFDSNAVANADSDGDCFGDDDCILMMILALGTAIALGVEVIIKVIQ